MPSLPLLCVIALNHGFKKAKAWICQGHGIGRELWPVQALATTGRRRFSSDGATSGHKGRHGQEPESASHWQASHCRPWRSWEKVIYWQNANIVHHSNLTVGNYCKKICATGMMQDCLSSHSQCFLHWAAMWHQPMKHIPAAHSITAEVWTCHFSYEEVPPSMLLQASLSSMWLTLLCPHVLVVTFQGESTMHNLSCSL